MTFRPSVLLAALDGHLKMTIAANWQLILFNILSPTFDYLRFFLCDFHVLLLILFITSFADLLNLKLGKQSLIRFSIEK